MKKVLLLTALVLGAASCQKDFTADVESRGEVDVQLSVAAPELIGATRTDGDAQNTLNSAYGAIDYLDGDATGDRQNWDKVDLRYSLEVYDVDNLGAPILDAPIKDRMVIIKDKYEPVKFDLRLIPNREYQFVIFADFVPQGTPADPVDYANQSEIGLRHTIGANLTQITIKQGEDKLNDEIADAYFKTFTYKPTNNTTNNINDTEDVILQRPYAKVRVIATDLAELNLNVEPKYVAINYNNTPILTAFNAVTGEISVDKVSADKEFEYTYVEDIRTNRVNHVYNAGYDADVTTVKNGTGTVERASHLTLFTDYILAKEETQSPISFTMTVFDENHDPIKTVDFNTNIPVQRNHLTTIIGNVLTAATDVTVTIDDNFANAGTPEERPFYQVAVSTGFEFVKAFYEGREIILQGAITVTAEDVDAYLATRADAAINPVINLNGYVLTFVNNGNEPLLTVGEGSSLTIVGDEDSAVVLEGTGVAIENNGELNVVDTTIEAEGEGSVFENNGEANIEGSTLNTGAVKNNGTANLNGSDVADDAVENSDEAIVGTYVYTADELKAAINAAEVGLNNEVSFGANIAGAVTILQKAGVNLIINGRGYEFDGVITVNGGGRATGKETLTFKAINFATEGSDFTFISAPSKINSAYNYSHNVTIEDCTFVGNKTVGSASFTGTYNFVMKNCKATNMHSILQLQSVDNTALVEGVEVVNCKSGLSFGNTAYPTLKNSTIKASEYGVRADGNASRGALVLEGNTIEANVPVIVRKTTTAGYNVALNGNTITKNGLFDVVFTKGDDAAAYVIPSVEYSISGADELVVFPYNTRLVSTADELVAALEAKTDVIFTNDIKIDPASMSNAYGATGINVKYGQTIDGQGHTLNIKGAGGTWDSGINTTGGVIKNLTVTGSFRGIFINHTSDYSEKVVLENVTIGGNGTVYTISCDQGLYQGIEATNCTFNGWTSFAKTAGEAKFVNCYFGEGSTYKYCRPYSNTEFVDCTFCPGYAVDTTRATVTFTDCTWEE